MKKFFLFLVLMFIGYAMNGQDLMIRGDSPLNKDSKIEKVLELKQQVQGVSTIDMIGTDNVALNERTDAISSLKRENTSKEVILFEGFESTTGMGIPAGWTRFQPGGGSPPWTSSTGISGSGGTYPLSGTRMGYNALYGPARDAWLISPAMAFEEGSSYSVVFWLFLSDYQGHNYFEAKIANAATQEAMVASTDILYYNTTHEVRPWTQIVAIFTAPESGDYYLGFHAFTPADQGDVIALDDIEVSLAATNNLSLVAPVYPLDQVPTSQTVLSIPVQVNNIGGIVQTNVTLSIEYNGMEIGSTTIPSIEPGESEIMSVNTSGVTISLGATTLTYTVSQDEEDSDPSDNTAIQTFTGTENTFAVDDGTVAYNVGYTASPISYGNVFTITQETVLNAVEMRFGASAATDFSISLYSVDGIVPTTPPIFTQPATKPTSAGLVTVMVPPTTLTPGDYYLCFNQLSNVSLAVISDGNLDRIAYSRTTGNLGNMNLNFGITVGALYIRMLVDLPMNDLQIVSENPLVPFTKIPESQAEGAFADIMPFPATLTAKAFNAGVSAQTNVSFSATFNGVSLGSSTPIASLASGATSAEMNITTPTGTVFPSTAGNHNFVFTVNQTEPDINPEDNSATYTLEIGNKYALDAIDVCANGVGSNSGTISAGNIFPIYNPTKLTSVEVGHGNGVALDYTITLFKMINATTIENEPIFTVPVTRIGGFSTITVPETLLTQGSYYLCVNQLTTENISLSYDLRIGSTRLYTKSLTGNTIVAQANFGAGALRMIVEDLPEYTINVTAGEGGQVIGGGTFYEGSVITVTATPNYGYEFVNWTDVNSEEIISESAIFEFTVTEDASLLATFKQGTTGNKITYLDLDVPYVVCISPDGHYVGGYIWGGPGFYWTDEDGHIFVGASEVDAISDNKLIVGSFFTGKFDEDDMPIFAGGYYVDDEWNELDMAHADGVSEDGTKIAGTQDGGNWDWVPVTWSDDEITFLDFESGGQGARVLSMSVDGRVISGWAAPDYTRHPVVWVDGVYKRIAMDGVWGSGEAPNVSPNGKYVALDFNENAAIYDVEKDELIIIGKFPDATLAVANAVSDDGIVIGYNQTSIGWGDFTRDGFIYKEEWGMVDLEEYLLNIGIDEAAGAEFWTPTGISANGKRIVGFGFWSGLGYVIDIEEHITGFYPPKNLTLTEVGFGEIDLAWEAPTEDPENDFSGYNVYRNGIKINSALISSTTFSDKLIPQGNHSFSITAVWNNKDESVGTREMKINIGEFSLPFMEDFSNEDFNINYWNVSPGSETRWLVGFNGIEPPCISFMPPLSSSYSEYFVSPYLNAADNEEVFLIFNLARACSELGSDEGLKVEVYNGEWHTIDDIRPAFEWGSFEYYEYDISEFAAGNQTRIRFVAYGENIGEWMYWNIDNIYIFGAGDEIELKVPLRVTAHKMEDGYVHINWADPGALVKLSYHEEEEGYPWNLIGNEGEPFISAAKFEAKDLIGYNGYKLVSISAYLAYNYDEYISEFATFKLAVFIGSERIVDQDITDVDFFNWNTFFLDEPIIISIDMEEPLYFGIEVVKHDEKDLPIGVGEMLSYMEPDTWEMTPYYEGRSNLTSIDGGVTWQPLTDYFIDGSILVRANLVSNDFALPAEHLYGYFVYRNDENIIGIDWAGNEFLTRMNNFTDLFPLDEEDVCYSVVAFYNIQKSSEKVTFCLGDPVNIDKVFAKNKNVFEVFPNPAYDRIYIYGENFRQATLYDFKGMLIMQTKENEISVGNLSSGIYILKIDSKDGKSMIQKVVKR